MVLHDWKFVWRHHNQSISYLGQLLAKLIQHRILDQVQSVGNYYRIVPLLVQCPLNNINKRVFLAL